MVSTKNRVRNTFLTDKLFVNSVRINNKEGGVLELGNIIKSYRNNKNMTQKELGNMLHVSDKTVSSWENNRTYPDISILIELSEKMNISMDQLLKGDEQMVKQIDRDVKLKKVYKLSLIIVFTIIILGCLFLNIWKYKNETIDRFNPFLQMEVGYAVLPEEITYNGGKSYNRLEAEKDDEDRIPQIPDAYRDIWVADDPFGGGMFLSFQGGQSPEGKHYAVVQHKGIYVKRITFTSWEGIPANYRNIMSKEYVEIPKDIRGPIHHK